MSKLSKTPPLANVQIHEISQGISLKKQLHDFTRTNTSTNIAVKTYLNDPLIFRHKETSKKIRQELALLKHLAHMELVLEKIHRLDIWKLKLDVSNKTLKVKTSSCVCVCVCVCVWRKLMVDIIYDITICILGLTSNSVTTKNGYPE
jgi:hypothetical protein